LIDQLGKEFGRDEESAPVYIGYSSGLVCGDFIDGFPGFFSAVALSGTDQQVAEFSQLDFVAGVEDFCVSEMDGGIGVGVLIRAQSRCKGFTTSSGVSSPRSEVPPTGGALENVCRRVSR